MMICEMKDIKGYEGLYAVNTRGQVWSYRRNKFLSAGSRNGDRYLRVMLCKNGNRKNYYVHQLVAQAFLPNPNNLKTVNHIDENPKNNNVDNLEWMSLLDNIREYYHNHPIRKETGNEQKNNCSAN